MTRNKRWQAKFSGFVSRWKQFLSLKNCRSVRICSVLNRSNRDTTVYYHLIFCMFSWPNMVKWHNSGIIKHISIWQICVLWLALSWLGFCSTDRFHGNGPIHVLLFWSKSDKFKFATKTVKKKWEHCHSSHWNYQKKVKRLKFFLTKLSLNKMNRFMLSAWFLN